MVVPTANKLASFAFAGMTENPKYSLYLLQVWAWDETAHTVVGEPIFTQSGSLPLDEVGLRVHDIGVLLPRDETHVVIVSTYSNQFARFAYVPDTYDQGEMVATNGSWNDPWTIDSGLYDLLFSMTFETCHADFNGDGFLNIFDFLNFQGAYNADKMQADCNGDGVLNILDFVCFQETFLQGCN